MSTWYEGGGGGGGSERSYVRDPSRGIDLSQLESPASRGTHARAPRASSWPSATSRAATPVLSPPPPPLVLSGHAASLTPY